MRKLIILTLLVALACTSLIQHCQLVSWKRKFKLEFQYACRQGVAFDSCKGDIFWNGKKIFTVTPCDYKVHTKVLYVHVNSGMNSLKFQGTGVSNGYGLTIDNVKLTRYGTKTNIVVNGGFEKPSVGKGWKIFNDIPGWWGNGFEVGSSHLYNCRWGKTKVIELDGHKNAHLTQKWNFNSNYDLISKVPNRRKFQLRFRYACRQNLPFSSCQGNVFWNGKKILSIAPKDTKIHT